MIEQLPTSDQRGGVLTDLDLERLQWTTLLYDLHEVNPDNGLIRDKTDPAAPSSIAATGLALATLPLSGRLFSVGDDLAEKIRRADEIAERELYVLRFQALEGQPLTPWTRGRHPSERRG